MKTAGFTVLRSSLAELNHEQSCVSLAPNVKIQKYSLGTLGSSLLFFVTVKKLSNCLCNELLHRVKVAEMVIAFSRSSIIECLPQFQKLN